MNRYIEDVVARGALNSEIERVQKMLVRLHENPVKDKEDQRDMVVHATKLFQALLLAKQSQPKTEG